MTAPASHDGAAFLDWWFAPWCLPHAPQAWPGGVTQPGPLARRHGYRLWCGAAGIPADLPAAGDPAWHGLASCTGETLARAARLYGGLLAARERDARALAALPLPERRWCMSVALTQPLPALVPGIQPSEPAAGTADPINLNETDGLARRGLAELACALDTAFTGLWPRLRLLLPPALADAVAPPAVAPAAASSARLPRCWRLCVSRAAMPALAEAA